MVEDWSLEWRYGMTDIRSFFSDQKYLFLRNIYSSDDISRENLTSFAVKRDCFLSFFSSLDRDECMDGTTTTLRSSLTAVGKDLYRLTAHHVVYIFSAEF